MKGREERHAGAHGLIKRGRPLNCARLRPPRPSGSCDDWSEPASSGAGARKRGWFTSRALVYVRAHNPYERARIFGIRSITSRKAQTSEV